MATPPLSLLLPEKGEKGADSANQMNLEIIAYIIITRLKWDKNSKIQVTSPVCTHSRRSQITSFDWHPPTHPITTMKKERNHFIRKMHVLKELQPRIIKDQSNWSWLGRRAESQRLFIAIKQQQQPEQWQIFFFLCVPYFALKR